MAVVLLDHSRARMSEILCDHHQRHSVHNGMACPGMSQTMKVDWRGNLRALIGLAHGLGLMIGKPSRAISLQEHRLGAAAPCRDLLEELDAVVAKDDMLRLARFRVRYRERPRVGIEVRD